MEILSDSVVASVFFVLDFVLVCYDLYCMINFKASKIWKEMYGFHFFYTEIKRNIGHRQLGKI